jgi:glycosyltransferase involved in cell wall biosynthesis
VGEAGGDGGMNSPRISLAMIVKDEQDNLDQCLASIAPHVDEIIVADTGSTDNTKAVARKYGAVVYDYNPQTHPQAFFVDDEATCSTLSAPPPYSGDVALGDFGGARNESFRHATGDFVLWVDADDVVEGADKLRQCVQHMASNNYDMGFLPYDYARDDQGRVFYRQWRERISRRGAAVWANPVHEVMLPARQVTTAKYGDVTISHRRKADRKCIPNRNYKILLRQLYQGGAVLSKVDPRTLFYLGQEARFIEPARAIGFYTEYLKRSGWPEERAAAHCSLGQLYEFGAGESDPATAYQKALREYAASALELPENPDGVFGAARVYYMQGRWLDCIRNCERGFAMNNPESMLGANPMDRLYRPHVYYNHALANVGRIEDAIKSCRAGLEVAPDDPGVPGGAPGMLRFNLDVYEKHLAAQKAGAVPEIPPNAKLVANLGKNEDVEAPPHPSVPVDYLVIAALQLWKQAVAANDEKRARALLESLGGAVASDAVVGKMRDVTARKWGTAHVPDYSRYVATHSVIPMPPEASRPRSTGLSIVFWTGPSIEPWDPTTPNATGIGGSETACIEMARELHRRGHKVTVYGECQGAEGNYDGVEYIDWHNCKQGVDCDVFISSRRPEIMEHVDGVRAKVKLLWVHDIHVGPAIPQMERWLYRFDRILCLSEWHKQFFCDAYRWLDPGKVVVTRNGIDPGRFAGEAAKTNRLHWSSSPNRGLDVLLYLFPEIRKRVPDVELHIYYGFEVWQAFANMRRDQNELGIINEYKRRIDTAVQDGGVHFHGRVSQKTLADALMRSKAWAYPTSFTETSCITAMEAQAAGCVPVCPPLAALGETVRHGVFVDQGNSERFIDEVCRLLTDETYRRPIADAGRKYALENLTWRGLAADWEAMFAKIADENRVVPVPLYREVAA